MGGAADDGEGLLGADVHLADLEAVGVGVLFGAQDFRHDHLAESRGDRFQGFDFEAGHGQEMAEFLSVQGGIDEATQPGFGELHDVRGCE